MSPVSDKRQALFDATLKLIVENGFHGTSMAKVAKEAGVSAGIIYHYFKSKDELIIELHKLLKDKFCDVVIEKIDDGQPLRIQVRQLVECVFRYYLAHPLEAVFVKQYSTSPYYDSKAEIEEWHRVVPIFACIEKAQEEMIIKDFPDEVMATLIVDVASSLAQKHAAGLLVLTDALVQQIIDALWEAIRY